MLAVGRSTTRDAGLHHCNAVQKKVVQVTAIAYICISILIIVGKLFARVILARLQQLAERIYPEFQFGLRAESAKDTHNILDVSNARVEQGAAGTTLPGLKVFVSRKALSRLLDKFDCT